MSGDTKAQPPVGAGEMAVYERMGRIAEFWGFKRNLGRVWTLLYLNTYPLSATDVQSALGISAGSVSIAVRELQRWGAIHAVNLPGSRKVHFGAESNVWRLVSGVLRGRERLELDAAIEALERARDDMQRTSSRSLPGRKHKIAQTDKLLKLLKVCRTILDRMLGTMSADFSPLKLFTRKP